MSQDIHLHVHLYANGESTGAAVETAQSSRCQALPLWGLIGSVDCNVLELHSFNDSPIYHSPHFGNGSSSLP